MSWEVLARCAPNLEELRLYSMQLDNFPKSAGVAGLTLFTRLKDLFLGFNQFSRELVEALACLHAQPRLQLLRLYRIRFKPSISPATVKTIFARLKEKLATVTVQHTVRH